MRRDESDVETAHKETGIEQPETAVNPGFAERLARRLFSLGGDTRTAVSPSGDPDREQATQRDQPRHDPQGLVIANVTEQHRRQRHDKELPK